jgi:glutathionyl-hydroquinone reductase
MAQWRAVSRPVKRKTCNLRSGGMDHIQKHYYRSHESINPTRIVAKGPILDFTEAHDRERFSDQIPQGNGYTRSA